MPAKSQDYIAQILAEHNERRRTNYFAIKNAEYAAREPEIIIPTKVVKNVTTNLVRYITDEEANSLLPANYTIKKMKDYNYKVADIDYEINPYTRPYTPMYYLSSERGVGTNIIGFLDADEATFMQNEKIDYKTPSIDISVVKFRTAFIRVIENCVVEDGTVVSGFLDGGVPYSRYQPTYKEFIKVPKHMIRSRLGCLMKSNNPYIDCSNEYEVNFITPRKVTVKATLYIPDDGNRGYGFSQVKYIDFSK